MPSKFARFRALSPSEQYVLVQAMLLLPVFWVGLRVFGLSRHVSWLGHSRPVKTRSPASEDLAPIGALVNAAGNHSLFPSTCLTRSLFLTWLLRRRGVENDLRIGVRFNGGSFEAHAWVEHEGRPVNDASDVAARFAAFNEPVSYRSFS
jgi:hypothetical protein